MEFSRYQKMIQKLAHVASARYDVEYEDMEAQGYLIYCECVRNFDITKSSFSTYLYINLSGRLGDYGISTMRQKGINLHDMLTCNDEESSMNEDNCILLSMEDSHITQENILDFAKGSLSNDGYTIFEWIISRVWEKKGRRKPSIYSAIEAFGWSKTRVQKCWEECKSFWLNEGAAFCC